MTRVTTTRFTGAAMLAWVLGHAGLAFAQAPDPRLADLDTYVEQVRSDWQFPGLAVAVVEGDRVLYVKGFGVRQKGRAEKVDADTLFEIGSTSKAFTTAALGLLVDEGKLRWDDPVVDHVPAFRLRDPWLTRHVTVRDLVSHRTGIADPSWFALGIMSPDQAMALLRTAPEATQFRDSFLYSNLMFGVAQKVVEARSGKSWQDFVRTRLFGPLGMTRSTTGVLDLWDSENATPTFMGSAPSGKADLTLAKDSDVAMPHGMTADGTMVPMAWQTYDNAAGAGSVISSANDMAKWLMPHLNEGRANGAAILRPETVLELHTQQNLRGRSQFPFEGKHEGYALGWQTARYRDMEYVAHGGGVIGFPAYVATLPDRKIGVVVLANGFQSVRDGYTLHKAIALHVFDRLLKAPDRDWRGEALARSRVTKAAIAKQDQDLLAARGPAPAAQPLEPYVGRYEDKASQSGVVRVSVERTGLRLAFEGRGAFSAALEPWKPGLFRLRAEPSIGDVSGPQFVPFVAGPDGKIATMTLLGAVMKRIGD
jgi:CubicO group peptidase (beta-lactamase class C family)